MAATRKAESKPLPVSSARHGGAELEATVPRGPREPRDAAVMRCWPWPARATDRGGRESGSGGSKQTVLLLLKKMGWLNEEDFEKKN